MPSGTGRPSGDRRVPPTEEIDSPDEELSERKTGSSHGAGRDSPRGRCANRGDRLTMLSSASPLTCCTLDELSTTSASSRLGAQVRRVLLRGAIPSMAAAGIAL